MTARVLLVDDDRAFRLSTAALLEEEGYDVRAVASAAEAASALEADGFDLLLLDLRMPGMDGITLVEVLRSRGRGIPVLMISGYGTVERAVEALHTGVDDFVTKPVEPEVLLGRVRDLLERRPGTGSRPQEEGGPLDRLVGRSTGVAAVRKEIEQVAGTDATVLVTGETGTGKELVARAVHELSGRRDGPFLAVNCAALAEGVLESELFGHRRGAFTGAVQDRPGLFRSAHGGTLFLDEIGDVPPAVQRRLLRVIQEGEVVPVGASRAESVDVRLLAATHRDLRSRVEAGDFREDLFFRLNVYRIHLPPLRERRGDVPLLVEHWLAERAAGSSPRNVSPLAMRTLLAHDWPGNVRELFAALESALIRAGDGPIQAQHLPAEVRESHRTEERYTAPDTEEDERTAIEAALRQADGVKTRAARILGMGRTTLWRKMREYGIGEGE